MKLRLGSWCCFCAGTWLLVAVVVAVVEAFVIPASTTASTRNNNHRSVFHNGNERGRCLYYANITKSSTLERKRKQTEEEAKENESSVVVFQKVVRPPSGLPDILFLGHLVEYLQEHFELPPRLPMVYTATTHTRGATTCDDHDDEYDEVEYQYEYDADNSNDDTENNNHNNHNDNEDRTLVCWDSPLSPCSDATCLRVEVFGIYTDSETETETASTTASTGSAKEQPQPQPPKQTVPPLAMVVVRKKLDNKAIKLALPPMLQSLFADSEKRILSCLDRGLDEFSAGTLKLFGDTGTSTDHGGANTKKNNPHQQSFQKAQEFMLEEMIEHDFINDDKPLSSTLAKAKNTAVMDADIVVTAEQQQLPRNSTTMDGGKPSRQRSITNNNKPDYSLQQEAALQTMTVKTPPLSSPASSSSSQKQQQQQQSATAAGPLPVSSQTPLPPPPPPPVGLDFAIQAARQAAAARRRNISNDFAVQSAARVAAAAAASRKQSPSETSIPLVQENTPSTATKPNRKIQNKKEMLEQTTSLQEEEKQLRDWSRSRRPPLLDPQNSAPRAFVTTISKPEDYRSKLRHNKEEAGSSTKEKRTKKKEPFLSNTPPSPQPHESKEEDALIVSAPEKQQPQQQRQNPRTAKAETARRLNLVVQQEKEPSKPLYGRNTSNDEAIMDSSNDALHPKNMEGERLQATKEALEDLASSGSDMTAEELLQSVLQFGDDQQKETQAGSGFVSGALEKAKDLLREQKRKRDHQAQQQQQAAAQSQRRHHDDPPPQFKDTVLGQGLPRDEIEIPYPLKEEQKLGGVGVETKVFLSPDEEIGRMFEAGERIADGRISVSTAYSDSIANNPSDNVADELQVDSLIAADKSVSSHARVLDDELAELELRINKSPDESMMDSARRRTTRKDRPVFDIFSGPEVYNPNVDAETAVNWPGALPGTRDVNKQLPGELREAIKQAQFAAGVLTSLEERQNKLPDGSDVTQFFCGSRELTQEQVKNLKLVVNEAVETGLIEDPLLLVAERSRLQMLLDELWHQPEERVREISSNYKDLLLSDHFVSLVKERLNNMADRDLEALRENDNSLEESHRRERELLGNLVASAQLLLKEARALGAELEAQQLEVIRSICKVAMDPRHLTEEDTAAALTDAVRGMRPLFDDAFVAYLKYAVAEEEGRLARAGLLDDPEHNKWLFVLKIVQQGVYKELERGISRYIDHIWYILRMETPVERRLLLQKLVDVMPTLDVRPFVHVVENIAGSLGDAASGDFDGANTLGEMTNKLLQLRRDVHDLLPPERIALMSRDADGWAARQKSRLLEQRKLTQQRLEAARQTEHLDEEIEALGRRGEMERIE